MASRYTKHQTEACRAKIQTTQLINRLMRHIRGKDDLSPTQVRSIEILLNKSLPNLQQAEIVAEVRSYVARLPEPAPDAAAWLASVDLPMLTSQPVSQPVSLAPDAHTQPIDSASVLDEQEPCTADTESEADDYKPGD
jgi:hypothetical protein